MSRSCEQLIEFLHIRNFDKNGQYIYPAEIGYTLKKDTSKLNAYLALAEVKSKFPSNLVFMYGKNESEDAKNKEVLPIYAIKTLDNGQAELEGDHVANAAQDFDERGKVAIKMRHLKKSSYHYCRKDVRKKPCEWESYKKQLW
mgnify:CR=1 FL=1